jgi:hypothetical protein
LEAIGTPKALEFQTFLGQEWAVLPRPEFDHPERQALYESDRVLAEILKLYEKSDLRMPFRRQMEASEKVIRELAGYLTEREHVIAKIGSIGVGKSTELCRLTGLELPQEQSPVPAPVLEVGGGGITLCEVHIKQGPQYGLIIEPRSLDEIKIDVTDFAEYLISLSQGVDKRQVGRLV